MPLRAIITAATTADCTCADELMEGFGAQHLIADKGYDSGMIIQQAQSQVCKCIYRHAKTVKIDATMMNISTACVIW